MIRPNISIVAPKSLEDQEIENYVRYLEDKYKRKLEYLKIDLDEEDDFVGLTYKFITIPFERIRRITGYLVGDMTKWNNAKYEEEKDRVKHIDNLEQL